MRCEAIKEISMEEQTPIEMLCSIANVPISTYYRYLIKGKFNA
jgi:hypothetical protein